MQLISKALSSVPTRKKKVERNVGFIVATYQDAKGGVILMSPPWNLQQDT